MRLSKSEAHFYAVTANDLMTGEAVFLQSDHSWSSAIGDLWISRDKAEAEAKAALINQQSAHLVVGAYMIACDADGRPVVVREQLRTTGPTNYHHGKQEITASNS